LELPSELLKCWFTLPLWSTGTDWPLTVKLVDELFEALSPEDTWLECRFTSIDEELLAAGELAGAGSVSAEALIELFRALLLALAVLSLAWASKTATSAPQESTAVDITAAAPTFCRVERV
jgi:hypothetical protein